MGTKIRRGTLSIGGTVAAVANFQWNDALEFDRSQADDEEAGDPVLMKRGGSGSFELLVGNVDSGYCTAPIVFTYKEVSVSSGSESSDDVSVQFNDCTINGGGNIPAEGAGRIPCSFEYGYRGTSDPDS